MGSSRIIVIAIVIVISVIIIVTIIVTIVITVIVIIIVTISNIEMIGELAGSGNALVHLVVMVETHIE